MYRKIDESFQPSVEQLEYWIESFYHSGLYLIKKENGEFTLCSCDEMKSGYDIPYFYCWQCGNDEMGWPIYIDKDGRRMDTTKMFRNRFSDVSEV